MREPYRYVNKESFDLACRCDKEGAGNQSKVAQCHREAYSKRPMPEWLVKNMCKSDTRAILLENGLLLPTDDCARNANVLKFAQCTWAATMDPKSSEQIRDDCIANVKATGTLSAPAIVSIIVGTLLLLAVGFGLHMLRKHRRRAIPSRQRSIG